MAKRRRSAVARKLGRLRRALSDAQGAIARLATLVRRNDRNAKGGTKLPLRRPVSRGRMAALKLQGSYIGHLRHLDEAQKRRVKAVRAKEGMTAAIVVAKRLQGSR